MPCGGCRLAGCKTFWTWVTTSRRGRLRLRRGWTARPAAGSTCCRRTASRQTSKSAGASWPRCRRGECARTRPGSYYSVCFRPGTCPAAGLICCTRTASRQASVLAGASWPCRRVDGCPLLQIWKLQPWLAEGAEALLKELEELPEPRIGMHIRSPGKSAVQARITGPVAVCQVTAESSSVALSAGTHTPSWRHTSTTTCWSVSAHCRFAL